MADIPAIAEREKRAQGRFVRIGVRYSGQMARRTGARDESAAISNAE
jgi:hypothetical protein